MGGGWPFTQNKTDTLSSKSSTTEASLKYIPPFAGFSSLYEEYIYWI
jgi:hypothetical protein